MPSSLLQVVNNLLQTCHDKLETNSANTTCWQLVNGLVTTCLQTCNNLCVFTRVDYQRFLVSPPLLNIATMLAAERDLSHLQQLNIFQNGASTLSSADLLMSVP